MDSPSSRVRNSRCAGEGNALAAPAAASEPAPAARIDRSGTDARQLQKVFLLQRRLTHYRVPLFEQMRDVLAAHDVQLVVGYGDPTAEEAARQDEGILPWAVHVPCRYWWDGRLCWQNAFAQTREASLVVLTQENRLLFNYAFWLTPRRGLLAYWGHGRNFQSERPAGLREKFKRWMIRRPDWWFAYTELSARIVGEAGFPANRMTVLNNAIDTTELEKQLDSVTAADVAAMRGKLGIGAGRVALQIASLHPDKRLDLLLQAARRLRTLVPDFHLVIVGDGPLRDMVAREARLSGGWIHPLGARYGHEKAVLLKMADVLLNPGMVGLGIVDSFIARLPMITMDLPVHSPEIAYLRPGVNGLITSPEAGTYAAVAAHAMLDQALLESLRKGCAASAREVTLERMAQNFCAGILLCLGRREEAATMLAGKGAAGQVRT